jgi:hypothetical protein
MANVIHRLPKIQEDIQKHLRKVEEELELLPKPPSDDPVSEINHKLNEFARDVSQNIEGMAGTDGLIQNVNEENRKFRLDIRRTAPEFRPYYRHNDFEQTPMPVPTFLSYEYTGDFGPTAVTDPIYIDDIMQRMEGYGMPFS